MTANLNTSDYVLSVKYPTEKSGSTAEAQDNVSLLAKELTQAGFYIQTRPGDDNTLLVFVKADDKSLFKLLKEMVMKDYLYGIKYEIENDEQIVSSLTETERLRAVYGLLTYPTNEGGIAITPGSGKWDFVNTITPIYNLEQNQKLFVKWLKKPLIDESDILQIKEFAGEKVALYFAYLRFYFIWLLIPTVLGFISNLFFKKFSIIFTILNSLWSIVFINAWKKKELIYSTTWGVKGCSKVEVKRAEFKGDYENIDLITGAKTPYFSPEKRTLRKINFIPTAIIGGILLLTFLLACFFVEIFLNEIYQGPGKAILGFVPTILVVGGTPFVTNFYTTFVKAAVDNENHETQSSYDASFTEKLYVHNFLSGYAPLFITIFLYLPFGHHLNSHLDTIQKYSSMFGLPVLSKSYQISTGRLVNQFSYFMFTALIVSFALENIVPVALRIANENYLKKSKVGANDDAKEAKFLADVRKQVALPKFDVNNEYRELVLNFGYLAMFGPVWSLAPLYCLISNYIEIKGDLEKLLLESQRPVPSHADSIKPWNSNLKVLTWIGTIICPLITTLFRQQDEFIASSQYGPLVSAVGVPLWKATSAALIFENLSIVLNFLVSSVYESNQSKVERDYEQKVLYLRRTSIDSSNKKSIKKDIILDKNTSAWKSFTGDYLLKQLLNKSEATDSAITTGAAVHTDANLKARVQTDSTVASKIVPKTDESNVKELKESITETVPDIVPTSNGSSAPATSNTESANLNRETSTPFSFSSETSTSLNGATLPPNFGLKKDLSNDSVPATSSSNLSVERVASENPIVTAAKSIPTVETKTAEVTKTLDPLVSGKVPVVSEKPEVPPKETSKTPVDEIKKTIESIPQHIVEAEHKLEEKASSIINDSFSSQSSTSTPNKSKGLFKSIKKKAQHLHLPTTPSKK